MQWRGKTKDGVELFTLALAIAAKGFRVFPCNPNSKEPACYWQQTATTDPTVIRTWAVDMNYGVVMDAEHFVLDLDCKGNKNGRIDLSMLEIDNDIMPATFTVKTPSGGEHLYLIGAAPNSVCKKSLGQGIDVRGDGGYVVGPGSIIDGKPYEITADREIAAAPDWLLKLAAKTTVEPLKRDLNISLDELGEVGRMRTHLSALVEQGDVAIEHCGGNDRTYKLFSRLLDHVSEDAAYDLVAKHWNPNCLPPWTDDELRGVLNNAVAYRQNDIGAKAAPSGSETFKEALADVAVVEARVPRTIEFTFPDVNQYGMPKVTPENTRIALKQLGLDCRYDQFHDKLLIQGHHLAQWAGEVSDHGCLMLRTMVRNVYRFEPTTKMMEDAAKQLCLQRCFDPIRDYLDGLKWDGVNRLDTWMVNYLGAKDTPLIRAFGRLSLIAGVRRVRVPGSKFDQIIVLEGPEGKNKSTAIETMAGKENFSDQHILGVDDKTQQELLKGVWLYEIADLSGIRKADVDKVKAFASRREDRSRPAFGHFLLNQPRRCVIFATTNNEEYLQADENRRFWPIKVSEIDIAMLKADRDQLWAEAAQVEATGVSIMLPQELWPAARVEQALRREHDLWDDLLGEVRGVVVPAVNGDGTQYEERISAADLLTHKLKLPADRTAAQTGKRLKAAMRRLGWEYHPALRVGTSKNGGYSRPCEAPAPADTQPGEGPALADF